MSANDEKTAQEARARRLRAQIQQIKESKEGADNTPEEVPAPVQESPRDFIHRAMREKAKKGPSQE